MDWAGKRVFLTGHTGFKGGWLSLWLQELGANVRGYALAPDTEPNLFTLVDVAAGMDSIIGDIRHASGLRAAMAEFRPIIVIHMAAQPLVRRSYEQPAETYATNVLGTVNVLEAVRACEGVRAVLVITSDKCYENHGRDVAYREDDPLGGYDPYSSSKACAELVAAAYRNSFFNPQKYSEHGVALATARAGNVIGGGDWAEDRLIPDMIRAFVAGAPVQIRNPNAVRPWQHSLEPLRGYLALCERLFDDGPAFAEAWNFGPDASDAKSVEWIVEKLVSLWGQGASWQADRGPHPHEAAMLRLDWSKAATRLGWRPQLRLAEALEATANWYSVWARGGDLRTLTLTQIAQLGRRETQAAKVEK